VRPHCRRRIIHLFANDSRGLHSLSDFVAIIRRRGAASTWGWSIHRRSRPLGVKFNEDGFKTWEEAKLAGEAALNEFLTVLAREDE
jgi:hypothetical protein